MSCAQKKTDRVKETREREKLMLTGLDWNGQVEVNNDGYELSDFKNVRDFRGTRHSVQHILAWSVRRPIDRFVGRSVSQLVINYHHASQCG